MAASCFVFADNNRKWQLAGEQKQIIDQKCKSATTDIDGEEYKAYYTLALPHCAVGAQASQLYEGLILEAYDADGSYALKAIHIAQHLG
jgi:GLPGLI family protein